MPPESQDIADPLLPALSKRPLIISGPCSAETREQVLATAERLAATGSVDLLRQDLRIHVSSDAEAKKPAP